MCNKKETTKDMNVKAVFTRQKTIDTGVTPPTNQSLLEISNRQKTVRQNPIVSDNKFVVQAKHNIETTKATQETKHKSTQDK